MRLRQENSSGGAVAGYSCNSSGLVMTQGKGHTIFWACSDVAAEKQINVMERKPPVGRDVTDLNIQQASQVGEFHNSLFTIFLLLLRG